ncbi:NfeD family protein [Hyphococcus luteus]|uniref:Serine protease n=1 Tax=Hyphococcus luteus TaxID=2058213 RepID=A0A2S7K6K2_9PROT|nr:nodulation protein NfeD [Marinicaulis flavus]PQA88144.1 serine protease [Marinicaulis flavus]
MTKSMRLWGFTGLFVVAAALLGFSALAQPSNTSAPSGVILTLDGAVTPPAAQYLEREIMAASEAGKEIVIIEIDTPGGLMTSMKTIIKAILASETPVATYVSPQGARSASAGLYIMYSAHVSAMAPATNTGAATPVEIGGSPSKDNPFDEKDPGIEKSPEKTGNPDASEGGAGAEETDNAEDRAAESVRERDRSVTEEDYEELAGDNPGAPVDRTEAEPQSSPISSNDALRAKAINDAVAYIRALAEERGRNADWAESAVRDAVSVTANEALRLNVVDLVASDLDDLLKQMNGRTVTTASGEKTLNTENVRLERVEATFVERILSFIADPNVAVILMSLATTGIIIEMWNPGSIFPGAVGLVCLILGFYSFQVLPFNWLGLALMGAGALFMLVEAYTPTFGLIGLVGLLLFGFGLFVVFPEGFRVSGAVIGAILAIAGGFLALILFAVVGSRSHGPLIGAEAIRKREGVVDEWSGGEGWILVEGERWRARCDKPLSKGDRVRVIEVDGLVLVVKQAKAGGLLGGLQPKEA